MAKGVKVKSPASTGSTAPEIQRASSLSKKTQAQQDPKLFPRFPPALPAAGINVVHGHITHHGSKNVAWCNAIDPDIAAAHDAPLCYDSCRDSTSFRNGIGDIRPPVGPHPINRSDIDNQSA